MVDDIKLMGPGSTTFKMAEQHTTLNEEKLTQLMRKLFQEEFKKQEVHITNLTSSHFKITMEEIKKLQEQVKEQKKEVTDLKSSVEHTDADLNDLSDRVDEIYDYQVDPEYVTNKLIDLEDRSRRNNLRIDGISESRNETWGECEEEIQEVFNEKLGIKNVQIERAHCSKRDKSNNNNAKPRTIVCRLLNYKQKEEILKNTKKPKGSNIFINEDFCYETMQYRKKLCTMGAQLGPV